MSNQNPPKTPSKPAETPCDLGGWLPCTACGWLHEATGICELETLPLQQVENG